MNLNLGISGEFRILKNNCEIARFKNKILQGGWEGWKTAGPIQSNVKLCLGSGDTPPQYEDTSLESQIAFKQEYDYFDSDTFNESEAVYSQTVYTFSFHESLEILNIREMGISNASDLFWSRALIVDADNNPISINKEIGETLIIEYKVKLQIPNWDAGFYFEEYTATARPAYANYSPWHPQQLLQYSMPRAGGANVLYYGPGAILGPLEEGPDISGTTSPPISGVSSIYNYEGESATTGVLEFSLAEGIEKPDGGISCILASFGAEGHNMQIGFDPPLPATDVGHLTLRMTISRSAE